MLSSLVSSSIHYQRDFRPISVNRQITICRPRALQRAISDYPSFTLCTQSRKSICRLLKASPLTEAEAAVLEQSKNQHLVRDSDRRQFGMSTLTGGIPCVPPFVPGNNDSIATLRRTLPIYGWRSKIIEAVTANQVIVLVGETGSGKTTQVPQYLLENATELGQNCRIICTQPRRLSALAVADRVACERNETTGQTVGFQIRLESKTCPKSNLIYCTNGILLRCLMAGNVSGTFANITHIIIDEIHERDKNADFLLISIRDALKCHPNLRLILMSATIDADVFSKYFDNCPQVHIPGRTFSVRSYYLEDILRLTGFQKRKALEQHERLLSAKDKGEPIAKMEDQKPKSAELDGSLDKDFVNELLEQCLKQDDQANFDQYIYMVESDEVPIDYQHSETELTILMIAAARGAPEIVQNLLQLSADPEVKTSHGLRAIDLALQMNNQKCAQLLFDKGGGAPAPNAITSQEKDAERQYLDILLDLYSSSRTTDTEVDRNLIVALIKFIHHQMPEGSILVFLPGYEDITSLHEMLIGEMDKAELKANLRIYLLHSNMKINDQKAVFNPAPFGCRKIILSTNIAETSITIDDVVYVIDSGKVKQNNFDVHTGTNCLELVDVSKACSQQRAGRAGRVKPGYCYKMFSRNQYAWLADYTTPELLRVPLTEICLSAKLIAPTEPIARFLGKAITPPLAKNVAKSVEVLQQIAALDHHEQITNLGVILADLPVEAHLGKMIIYAIVFKCVDPILTIVSALSVKSLFTIPGDRAGKVAVGNLKASLAENAFSDHLVLLRVFQQWLAFSAKHSAEEFCRRNFLNGGSLQTICGMRSLILGHLRACRLVRSSGKGNIHDLNANSKNWAVVKACLVAGLYPNVCQRMQSSQGSARNSNNNKCSLKSGLRQTIYFHKQSVLASAKYAELPADWVVFEEKMRTTTVAMIDCNTVVSPQMVALFAGSVFLDESNTYKLEAESDSEDSDGEFDEDCSQFYLQLNEWITFKLSQETVIFVIELRQKFNALLLRMLCHHDRLHMKLTGNDQLLLTTMIEVITAEDRALQMVQPKGIGDRPQAVYLDFSADVNFGIQEPVVAPTAASSSGAASRTTRVTTGSSSWQAPVNARAKRKYFVVRAGSRTDVKNTLNGSQFHLLLPLKEAFLQSTDTTFVIFFVIPMSEEFFGCGLLEPRSQQQANRLCVKNVSQKNLWFNQYAQIARKSSMTRRRNWKETTGEVSQQEGELLYTHFR